MNKYLKCGLLIFVLFALLALSGCESADNRIRLDQNWAEAYIGTGQKEILTALRNTVYFTKDNYVFYEDTKGNVVALIFSENSLLRDISVIPKSGFKRNPINFDDAVGMSVWEVICRYGLPNERYGCYYNAADGAEYELHLSKKKGETYSTVSYIEAHRPSNIRWVLFGILVFAALVLMIIAVKQFRGSWKENTFKTVARLTAISLVLVIVAYGGVAYNTGGIHKGMTGKELRAKIPECRSTYYFGAAIYTNEAGNPVVYRIRDGVVTSVKRYDQRGLISPVLGYFLIHKGMTFETVVDLLGRPADREANESHLYLMYYLGCCPITARLFEENQKLIDGNGLVGSKDFYSPLFRDSQWRDNYDFAENYSYYWSVSYATIFGSAFCDIMDGSIIVMLGFMLGVYKKKKEQEEQALQQTELKES